MKLQGALRLGHDPTEDGAPLVSDFLYISFVECLLTLRSGALVMPSSCLRKGFVLSCAWIPRHEQKVACLQMLYLP